MGKNCSLTNVDSITVYQSHDGSKFAVATDNQGNQIKAEAITNGSSTGVNGTLLSQGTLSGVINHEASAINALAAVGFGGRSVASGSGFDKNAYDIHESNAMAADYFGGFGKSLAVGAAIGAACTATSWAPGACLAFGLGESAAHNPQGADFITAGAGGGVARTPAPVADAVSTAPAIVAKYSRSLNSLRLQSQPLRWFADYGPGRSRPACCGRRTTLSSLWKGSNQRNTYGSKPTTRTTTG